MHFSLAGTDPCLKLPSMTTHIIIGVAFAVLFILLGCVAFLYLVRGKN